MNNLHVHMAVDDMAAAVRLYAALFAAEPTVQKTDYPKWMLKDPHVNFSISSGHGAAGIQNLGIQVEDETEPAEVYDRLKKADAPILEEGDTMCFYAKSEKSWISDPRGLAWETFLTHGESTVYGGNGLAIATNTAEPAKPARAASGCCGPAMAAE